MTSSVSSVLGIMSGSSLDGVDLALVTFSGHLVQPKWLVEAAETIPFPPDWADRLASLPEASALDYAQTHVDLGQLLGRISQTFIDKYKLKPLLIASHGHTIFHHPNKSMTAQIGDGASIAALTGIPVVTDFRSMDVALGGQGAPFVPVADAALFVGHTFYLNLGGIANISHVANRKATTAFDVAPANQLFNYLARQKSVPFDRGGEMGRIGFLHNDLFDNLEAHPYYRLKPPKSLDNSYSRETFFPIVDAYDIAIEDKLCTCYHHVATRIKQAVDKVVGTKNVELSALVTGGGAHNDFLFDLLREKTKGTSQVNWTKPSEEIIDFKEAILMAYLGLLRWERKALPLSEITGARTNGLGGSLYGG